MTDTADKIALVTGASRGLGYHTAVALGAAGWHVIALARTTGGLEEAADAIEAAGGTSTLVPLDVTDDGGLQRLGLSIHQRWGRLDLWVHCAAHAANLAPAESVDVKDIDRSLAVNARAAQRLIVMLAPLLQAAPAGHAVHTPDATRTGAAFFSSYGASKAAQTACFDSWAAESQRKGPRVTPFTPAPMATALRARFYPGEPRDPLARPADEAARLVASLAATVN